MCITTNKRRIGKYLLLLLATMAACEKVVFEPPEVTQEISYATEIQPIWDAKCVDCHPPTKGLDLTAENSFNNLVPEYVAPADSADPENSDLYRKLTGSSHVSRTSELEKATVLKWITQGAPDN